MKRLTLVLSLMLLMTLCSICTAEENRHIQPRLHGRYLTNYCS